MARTITAGFSAIIIYGIVCLPGNALIGNIFRENINADGSVFHIPAVMTFLLGHLIYSLISGIGIRLISHTDRLHTARLIGLVCMLLVSIGVTIGYWNLMPKWYHLLFFVILIPMMWLGTRLSFGRK